MKHYPSSKWFSQRSFKLAIFTIIMLMVSGTVSALRIDTVSGTWSNPIASGASPCIGYQTVGTEAQIRFGRASGASTCANSALNSRSGYGFKGGSSITFIPGEFIRLGDFTHYNNPIYSGTGISAADLAMNLVFGDPNQSATVSKTFDLDETPNTATPCAYGGPQPCADQVSVNTGSIPFTLGGVQYLMVEMGFIPGSMPTCTYDASLIKTSFISEENAANTACIFARVLFNGPHINIEKTPDLQTVNAGQTATFSIFVINDGSVALSNVTVTDPLAPNCARTIGSLAVGASTTYSCTLTNVTADFTNIANVSGTNGSTTATDSDTAVVDALVPVIKIATTPDGQQILSGSTVPFTFTVTNTGEVPLSAVTVTDADCTTGPTYQSGDTNSDGILQTNETWVYTCNKTNVTSSLTTTGTAKGNSPTGMSVTATDPGSVVVINPKITIATTPDGQQIISGTNVTFTFTVKNTGDVPLSSVSVTDADCSTAPAYQSGDTNSDNILQTTETWVYTCVKNNVTASLTTTGTAKGTSPISTNVTATDPGSVVVINPKITIATTPDGQQIISGTNVTFTFTVKNTGDVPLNTVSVTDADCSTAPAYQSGDTNSDNILQTTETWVYTCVKNNVTASLTTTGTAKGTSPISTNVSATDPGSVVVINPAISIATTPDGQQILSGTNVTFTFTVKNTGDVPLSTVSVTDADCSTSPTYQSGDTNSDNILQTTETWVYTCVKNNVTASLTTTGTAKGTSPISTNVTATDPGSVVVINPAISIATTPDGQQILSGTNVTFTFTVKNTGDVPLNTVSVTDADCSTAPAYQSGDTNSDSILQTTETWVYTCVKTNVTASLTTTGTAKGTSPISTNVTATDPGSVVVINPAISIATTPDGQQILSGTNVTFTFTVKNTGDVPLSTVSVTDADCSTAPAYQSGDTNNDNILQTTETWVYTCVKNNVTASLTTTGTAKGTSPISTNVTATDPGSVVVISPAISIATTPDGQQIISGTNVTFTFTVKNTGDVPLNTISVMDADCSTAPAYQSGDTNNDNILQTTETWVYTCVKNNVTASLTTTGTAKGTSPISTNVTATDPGSVVVINPAISIATTPDGQQILSGTNVTFTFTVKNTGDVPLNTVSVTDADCSTAPAYQSGDTNSDNILQTTETWVYTCVKNNVTSNMTTIGTAKGNSPISTTVTATDPGSVVVIHPVINIATTPDGQQVVSGSNVTFTFTVTNPGDVPLSSISVTDADCSTGPTYQSGDTNSDGILQITETWVYTCVKNNVTADLSTIGTAKGTSPISTNVTATDPGSVNVLNPVIRIRVTPASQTVVSGDTANFTLTVTNPVNTPLSSITVTAPQCSTAPVYQSGDTNGDNRLQTTETWIYTCSTTNVTTGFTLNAKVTGKDVLNNTVTDTDLGNVLVINPKINIATTPNGQQILSGTNVTFTFTVTNTGDVPLSTISVTDADCPAAPAYQSGDTNSDNILQTTETWVYTCAKNNVTASLTTTGTAKGNSPTGSSVTATDPGSVVVISPAIKIATTPDGQQILSGTNVTFTFTVTNTGDAPLTGVTVTDPDCTTALAYQSGDTNNDGILQVTETWVYTCVKNNVTASMTTTGTAKGTSAAGNTVTATDPGSVVVINPVISIATTPDGQQILSGTNVTLTFTVKNTGDVPLSAVTVTDADCPATPTYQSGDTNNDGILQVTETWVYTCVKNNVTASMTTTGTAKGNSPLGNSVTATDPGSVVVINPKITIATTPDGQQVLNGSTVTFTFTVKNTGDVPLSTVSVTDPDCAATPVYQSGDTNGDGILQTTETWVYACTKPNVTTSLTTTGTAKGTSPISTNVTATDPGSVTVINPKIAIVTTPDGQQILSGTTVIFTFTVTNMGDVPLSSVSVTDPDCSAIPVYQSGDTNSDSILQTTETWVYTCSKPNVTTNLTTTGTANGNSPVGNTVTATDPGSAVVIHPAISIATTPDDQQILTGTNVTFTFTVKNTGDVPLSTVTVTDADCSVAPTYQNGDTNNDGILQITETWVFSCAKNNVTASLTTTGTAKGTSPISTNVTATDSGSVAVINPAISIATTPDGQQVVSGSNVTFTFTVKNAGDVPLTSVSVTDADCSGAPAYQSGDTNNDGILQTTETWVYTCSKNNVTSDLTTIGMAKGTSPISTNVTATDPGSVNVINPVIRIDVTPDTQMVVSGGKANFTLMVTNPINTPLTNVVVTAPQCSAAPAYQSGDTNGDGILQSTETWLYTCSTNSATTDFTLTGTVTAKDAANNTVTDTDQGIVDVINPAISIATTPDGQQILSGTTVTFAFTVKNTGDVPLSGVSVADADCAATPAYQSGDTNNDGILQLTETWIYSCNKTNVTASLTTTGTAKGNSPAGNTVTAADPGSVVVINPAISIATTPDGQQILSGSNVTFTFTAKNTGDVPLSSVSVTDDDCAAAPVYESGDTNNDGILQTSETWGFTCTKANVTSDISTIGAASGVSPAGNMVTANDPGSVLVIHPAISIATTPDDQQILSGNNVTFTFTVKNTGDVPLSTVSVADVDCPAVPAYQSGDTNNDGILQTNETWVYTCNKTNVTASLTTSGTAKGNSPVGNTVTANDPGSVVVIHPAISIATIPDGQQVVSGSNVTFTFTVTNTGDVPLNTISVADTECAATPAYQSGDTNNDGILQTNETWVFSCVKNNVTADLTTVGTAKGNSALGNTVTANDPGSINVVNPAIQLDITPNTQTVVSGSIANFTLTVTNPTNAPLSNIVVTAPQCSATPVYQSGDTNADNLLQKTETWVYTCSTSNATTDFTLNGTVNGRDSVGNTVTDTDQGIVDVINPAISIATTPDNQPIVSGSSVTFTFTVKNIGDVPLSAVSVTDADCSAAPVYQSGDTNNDGILQTTETWVYSCTKNNVTSDLTTTGSANGSSPLGNMVTATDPGSVVVINPAISIATTPDGQQILSGTNVTFTFTVKNTGDVPLSAVSVTDADCSAAPVYQSGDTNNDGILQTTETWVYSCTKNNVTSDLTTTGTAKGTNPAGNTITASDPGSVVIIHPAISIATTPDGQQILSGTNVTFTFTVKNTGDIALSGISITDPDCTTAPVYQSGDTNNDGILQTTETWVYTCSKSNVAADLTTIGTAKGTSPLGNTVTATDSGSVVVIHPAISIATTPDGQEVVSGSTVTFTFTVKNTGDVPLSSVAVTNNDCAAAPIYQSGDTNNDGILQVDETWVYTCSKPNVTADLTTIGTAKGNSPLDNTVTATDPGSINVTNPFIRIEITPDTQMVLSGSTANFTLTVTNPATTPISNIVVTAPLCSAAPIYESGDSNGDGILQPNEAWVYKCAKSNTTTDFTLTGAVEGKDTIDNSVTDTDQGIVDVINPAVSIATTPDGQQVLSGSNVTITFVVQNTGDVPLSAILVTDTECPSAPVYQSGDTNGDGILQTTETWVYTCVKNNVMIDLNTTGTVNGTSPLGSTVTATDSGNVDVIHPAINIITSPDGQQITSGSSTTLTFNVTNAGDVPLSSVSVTDADCAAASVYQSGDTNGDGVLQVGETWFYACSTANLTADLGTTGTAKGTSPLGNTVTASDNGSIDVINPTITIDVTPDSQTVLTGSTVNFTLTVTNPGDAPISNLVVNASECSAKPVYQSGDSNGDGILQTTETWVYSCSTANATADFMLNGKVEGKDALGNTVSDTDLGNVDVIHPAISIATSPDGQQITSGSSTTLTFNVTNAGDVPLNSVSVTDADCAAAPVYQSGDINGDGVLQVGETWLYACSTANLTADLGTTGTAQGNSLLGNTVTASDNGSVDVINPTIHLSVTPSNQMVLTGSTVNFTLTVTNPGDAPVSNIVVTAPQCSAAPIYQSGDTNGDGILQTTETWLYACSTANATADFTLNGKVEGKDALGNTVSDTDLGNVDVIHPAISITTSPDGQQITSGSSTTLTFNVTNAGDVPLSSVSVTDADCAAASVYQSGDTNGDGVLQVGETWLYACSTANLTADLSTTGTAQGNSPLSNTVTASDNGSVDVINPTIHLSVTPSNQMVLTGSTVNFTLTVTNPGDAPISNLVVNAPECSAKPVYQSGDTNSDSILQPSETWVYKCSTTNATSDFTVNGKVEGKDALGNILSDTDLGNVNVINPAISIATSPDSQQITSGSSTTLTFAVTNAGDVPLSSVVVTDPDCSAAPIYQSGDTNGDGILQVGETWVYSCSTANLTADLGTTGTAKGTSPLSNTVPASDNGSVDVINPTIHLSVTPSNQMVLTGSTVNFTLTITNPGDAPISNLVVNAPECSAKPVYQSGDTNGDGILQPSETWVYSCSTISASADFTLHGKVEGKDALNNTFTDTDLGNVDIINPAIRIATSPDGQPVTSGSNVKFTFKVTNAGDVPLNNITVTDPDCDVIPAYQSGDINGDGILQIGETWIFTCTKSKVTTDLTTTGTAKGTSSLGNTVTATDPGSVDVINPNIQLSITPDHQVIMDGATANFTLTITNSGDAPFSNLVVTALECSGTPAYKSGDINGDGILQPGESWVYTCSTTRNTSDFTLTGKVEGKDVLGNTVTDFDNSTVEVIHPAIQIKASADTQQISEGSVEFIYQVTNTGDVPLQNITVTDPNCSANPVYQSGDSNGDGILQNTETWVFTCTRTNISSEVSTTATVSGLPVGDVGQVEVVSANDSVNIVLTPTATPVPQATAVPTEVTPVAPTPVPTPIEIPAFTEPTAPAVCALRCTGWQIYHTNRNGQWDIFRLGDIPGQPDANVNLTQGNGYDSMSPSRSPNGAWIIFTSNRTGNWELYVTPTDGEVSRMRQLTFNTTAIDTDPVWGPNNLVAFESNRNGNWDIFVIDMTTGKEYPITSNDANDINANWSPDGTKLMFQSDRSGQWQIYELDMRESTLRVVSDSTGSDVDAIYSSDGEMIAFRSYRDGKSVIYVMNADGTDLTPISDPEGEASNQSWSPNDNLLTYQSDLDGDLDVYVYELDSKTTRKLTDNAIADYAPMWLCDGTNVIFTSDVAGNPDIYELPSLPIISEPIVVEEDAIQLTNTIFAEIYPESAAVEENASREGLLPSLQTSTEGQTSFLRPDVSIIQPDFSSDFSEEWLEINSCRDDGLQPEATIEPTAAP